MKHALELSNSKVQCGKSLSLKLYLQDNNSSSVITYYVAGKLDPSMELI